MDSILVIVVPVTGVPEIKMISYTLEELQGLVGGYIETDLVRPGVVAIVNEDGMLHLPRNGRILGRYYCGTVVFAGYTPGSDELRSMTYQDIAWVVRMIDPRYEADA